MPSAMSAVELRSLVAAQIVTVVIKDLPPNSSVLLMKEVAETAVKMAKIIEEEAARSTQGS